jgi:polysaccharide pyruvyl transferase WcaK-like protein
MRPVHDPSEAASFGRTDSVRVRSGLQRQPALSAQPVAVAAARHSGRGGWQMPAVRGQQSGIAPARIGLFGLFGSGNSGNDGSLEAMIRFLREVRPDAELVCFCACSAGADDVVARAFCLPAIPFALAKPEARLLRILDRLSLKAPRQLASLVRAITLIGRVDLLIVPGTGILDDFQDGPLGMPLALVGWCLAARLRGVKLAFISIGAGPIRHPISRWLMKSAVTLADYRSYRDVISKAFMESIGFDTGKDAVYPDLAFKLPTPLASNQKGIEDRPLTVGVGVMAYYGWRNRDARGPATYTAYAEKIADFVLWLLDRGYIVRILTGHASDQRAVDDLVARVMVAKPALAPKRLLSDPSSSLHDLMRQIAQTDVVVATRFHNVVCALKLCKPTVAIGYAEKFDVLMAEMGLGSFCQHVERLDVDLLAEQFTRLVAGRKRYHQIMRDANAFYQERLKTQDLLLASRFLGVCLSEMYLCPYASKGE